MQKFSKEVEIIIQTVTEDEYRAATTFFETPNASYFPKAVVYPMNGMIVGMFAVRKTALIQTEFGENIDSYIEDALKVFSNAQFVIGVGACFAFDQSRHQLGDVLVSEKISDLANLKFGAMGKIENHGQIVDVAHELKRIFCITVEHDSDVKVSKTRNSKVDKGTFISHPIQMNSRQMCDAIHAAVPTAVGGEMEGGKLLNFVRKRKVKGVIIIKGVADYGDGLKIKEWQFTATMSALHYVKAKLPLVSFFAGMYIAAL